MNIHIGMGMVRRRVIASEDADAARIDALRKELREKREGEVAPRPSFLSWLRRRRALVLP